MANLQAKSQVEKPSILPLKEKIKTEEMRKFRWPNVPRIGAVFEGSGVLVLPPLSFKNI